MRLDNDMQDSDPQEREISLGTATILGIFLALALVCAAFFGFGYSMGRHATPSAAATPAPDTKTDAADSTFSQFKSQPTPAATDNSSSDNAQADTDTQAPATSERAPEPVAVPQTTAKAPAVARNVTFPVPSQPAATARTVPAAGGSQSSIVQVSATSRRGDAEALIAALQQKGYAAAIRQEPQDKLFHVQIGPFATKVEANAMRKRLDTDGYKAIVK